MILEHIKQALGNIREGGARVDHSHIENISALHFMTVDTDPFESDSVSVGVVMDEGDPLYGWRQVTRGVVPAYLKITPVFSHAQREHSVFNQFLLIHNIKYRPHMWASACSSSHPQNSIGLLRIKQIGFNGNAPESEVECVFPLVILLSKVNHVLDQEPLVHAALPILLLECTLATLHAGA